MPITVKRSNPNALKKLLKRIKSAENAELAVGIPVGSTGASAQYPDGTDVLLVAAVNNFGSPSRGIPAREFMSESAEPMIEATTPIAEGLMHLMNSGDVTAEEILEKMGPFAVSAMQDTIDAINTPANAESTIKAKKSSNPLINTRLLVQSITSAVRGKS